VFEGVSKGMYVPELCVCERERGRVTSKALVPLSIKSNLVSTPKVRSPGQSDEQE
jgi:hypothetical protein